MTTIDDVNLKAVDLNLLVAFEALLAERNVSRAADRIGLTQPAMSNALSRLRALFGDELFVRTPREMRPTLRALELGGPVCDALRQVRTALASPRAFEARTAERLFTVACSDNADFSLAQALPGVRHAAPNVDIEIVATDSPRAMAMLDDGVIDLALGWFPTVPKRFFSAPLYSERYVCLSNRDVSRQMNSLTLDSFVALPHLLVVHDAAGSVDKALAARHLERRIAVVVPNFSVVPYVLEQSDLLTVVGARIGRRFADLPWIAMHDLPFEQDAWTISALWGRHGDADDAVMWLRRRIEESCAKL